MCMVSMIYDSTRKTWPGFDEWNPFNPNNPWQPGIPGEIPLPAPIDPYNIPIPNDILPKLPTLEQIKKFEELLDKAKEFDKMTKQENCEDPNKAVILAKIEILKQILESLEKDLKGK